MTLNEAVEKLNELEKAAYALGHAQAILYTDGDLVSLIAYTGLETDLTLPSGIVEIYQYAFYGCSDLTSVTIDNSLFLIGNYAFYNCNGLKIIFKGTQAEWNAVYKGSNWCPSSATVTCIGEEEA